MFDLAGPRVATRPGSGRSLEPRTGGKIYEARTETFVFISFFTLLIRRLQPVYWLSVRPVPQRYTPHVFMPYVRITCIHTVCIHSPCGHASSFSARGGIRVSS